MKKGSIVLVLFCLLLTKASAQNKWTFGAEYKTGVLAAHRSIIDHVPREKVHAFKLLLNKPIDIAAFDKKEMRATCGFSAIVSSAGNQELIGNFFGLSAYGNLPIFSLGRWGLYNHSSVGLGYAQKVYDEKLNPLNNVISTHVNALIELGLQLHYRLDKGDLIFKSDITHLSNGGLKLPNFGLNYFFLGGGYVHRLNSSQSYHMKPVFKPFSSYDIHFLIGAKSTVFSDQKKHPVYGLNFAFRRIRNERLGVEISLDGVYKTATQFQYPELNIRKAELFQLGIFAGHVMSFNKLSTLLGMGAYIVDPLQPQDAVYHRVGVRYQIRPKLKANLILKANWGKADYLEWGIIYSLNKL